MKKSKMNTFADVVVELERRLKAEAKFFVARSRADTKVEVPLLSLRLQEVIHFKDAGKQVVRLILNAEFKGGGPHEMTGESHAINDMGLKTLSLGMGAVTHDTGMVEKGMSVHLTEASVKGGLAKAFEAHLLSTMSTTVLRRSAQRSAVAKVKDSAPYKRAAQLLKDTEEEVKRLRKVAKAAIEKLEGMEQRATTRAGEKFARG